MIGGGDGAGPQISPTVVIGLGPWGRAVAAGVEQALRERSPELAQACLVLAMADGEPDPAGLIRSRLRASRDLAMIRSLEAAGLIRIDPVVAPATHVYLVASGCDELGGVAALVMAAAGGRRGDVRLAAVVDVGDGDALPAVNLPVFVVEPVTSHGLVLGPEEYQAAVAEVLVAAAQPGGGHLLMTERGAVGTVGISWLSWSPVLLRRELAGRLSREALLRCLGGGGREPGVPAVVAAAVRATESWRIQTMPERLVGLTRGLPFTIADDLSVALPERLFGRPDHRKHRAAHIRRCAAVLDRRAMRWERLLERNARTLAEREGEALAGSLTTVLGGGVAGLSVASALVDALGREAALRLEPPPPEALPPRLLPVIEQVRRAEAAPLPHVVWIGLAAALLLTTLIWSAVHGDWLTLLGWGLVLGVAGAGYELWRPWQIDRATRTGVGALRARAAALARSAVAGQLVALDEAQEARCEALAGELSQGQERLRALCRASGAGGGGGAAPGAGPGASLAAAPGAGPGASLAAAPGVGPGASLAPVRSALSQPLLPAAAIDAIHRDLQPQVPDLVAYIARGGALLRWREPEAAVALAEALTLDFLAGRLSADIGQLAASAYGDRLGERLHVAVRGLLDWSHPLLGRVAPLPEGERWLLWPHGLPCPPVAPDVQVIPAARSCAAALTVVRGLRPASIRPRAAGAAAEHPA